jgi:hypothetical protein
LVGGYYFQSENAIVRLSDDLDVVEHLPRCWLVAAMLKPKLKYF